MLSVHDKFCFCIFFFLTASQQSKSNFKVFTGYWASKRLTWLAGGSRRQCQRTIIYVQIKILISFLINLANVKINWYKNTFMFAKYICINWVLAFQSPNLPLRYFCYNHSRIIWRGFISFLFLFALVPVRKQCESSIFAGFAGSTHPFSQKIQSLFFLGMPFMYYSYQRSWHTNEANGSFPIVLIPKPRLHGVVNKRNFVCELNCNNSYFWLFLAPEHPTHLERFPCTSQDLMWARYYKGKKSVVYFYNAIRHSQMW